MEKVEGAKQNGKEYTKTMYGTWTTLHGYDDEQTSC